MPQEMVAIYTSVVEGCRNGSAKKIKDCIYAATRQGMMACNSNTKRCRVELHMVLLTL